MSLHSFNDPGSVLAGAMDDDVLDYIVAILILQAINELCLMLRGGGEREILHTWMKELTTASL